MIMTQLHNFPTVFISFHSGKKAGDKHQPANSVLLQFWKQQEDSAMLLARNRPTEREKKN
jgi:hypothetical protein